MIDFTRAFDSAWERMHVILFRPFDPAKWLVIGFNAFLVLLAEGGVAINNPFPIHNRTASYQFTFRSLPELLHGFKQSISWAGSLSASPWLALYIALGFVYFAVWLVGNWVGCRGQFIFLDNIVRNRAAIALPWKKYARQGNIWFLFHLGLILLSSVFFLSAAGAFLAFNWSWINAERNPAGNEVAVLTSCLLIFFGLWIIYAAGMFLIRSFVIPLYFKQSMGLGAALLVLARLVVTRPVSIGSYLLISFVLAIASGLLALLIFCVACCVICWLACIPLIGSMLLSLVLCQLILPLAIFLRCFQLDCLAQFGPECDVWTVDVPPSGPAGVPLQPSPG
ncbi:MAG TPA: hypothetical protein VGZ93_00685 [Candidatus Methylacidiphilales bacterium]|jgi:hypothetical protein|nr:hypothetical protein [Candidatus Methylacidiphilales bacterium]